jgi:diguanylate cyclase (GGDEF)-like protein
MKQSLFSIIFITVSTAVVYFSQDFVFIRNYLKISPPLVVILAGLTFLICLRFNKSRVAFMLALLLVWFFKSSIPGIVAIPENPFLALISLNILYLAGSGERGVFSIHGLRKAVIIVFQFVSVYYFTVYDPVLYQAKEERVVRYLHLFIDLPYAGLPFMLLSLAAINNIFRDRRYDLSFALGAVSGLTILSALGNDLSALNMTAVFLMMFIGTLSSIYTISYVDELTGLPGRRAYNEYTATLGSKYTIAMADIDHFKKFNDTYGHDTGDEVLKLVARVLSTVGGGGKTFRFGGEEFVIVFNGKRKENTAAHLEHLRKQIAQTPFTVRNRKSRKQFKKTGVKSKPGGSKNIKITMSFGAGDSREGKRLAGVMKEADVALYKSKKKGRNRVTV